MKEIKLNDYPYFLRKGRVESARIDETKLEFRNGVAVAEATVAITGADNHMGVYVCSGLINEKFEEVFGEKVETNFVESALMFIPGNKRILRFGDDDFIVDSRWGADVSNKEYLHIRTQNGVLELMNYDLGPCTKTSDDTIAIIGEDEKALYSIEHAKELTPYVESISESETYDGIFDVIAKVKPLDVENYSQLLDFLYFKMNAEGRCVSSVLSSLENGYIYPRSNILVSDLLEERREELTFRAQTFEDMVNSFQSNDRGLEKAGYVKKR